MPQSISAQKWLVPLIFISINIEVKEKIKRIIITHTLKIGGSQNNSLKNLRLKKKSHIHIIPKETLFIFTYVSDKGNTDWSLLFIADNDNDDDHGQDSCIVLTKTIGLGDGMLLYIASGTF